MKAKFKIVLLLLFIQLFINALTAQNNDFEIWSGIGVKKKISDRISAVFTEEVRFNDNATSVDKFFSDIGILYKLTYKLKIGTYYRFIKTRELNANYHNQHRYYFDLIYTERKNRLKISNRLRFQSKYNNIYGDATGFVPSNYFRNKISAEYDIKNSKITPNLSVELYYKTTGKNKNQFNKVRFTGGLEYKLSKKSRVGVFYRIQNSFNVKYPLTSYILGTGYSYKL